MKRILAYFDRCYIINLSDRHDRRIQVAREFRRAGADVASDNVKFYTATRPLDKGDFPDIGSRGCYDSHKNILKIAARDELKNVLIFEDDVSFRQFDAAFEQELVSKLSQEDWDLMFFGYLMPQDDELVGPLMRWRGDIQGAHFYAVNGGCVRKLLKYMDECESRPRDHPDGGPMPVDGIYNHIRYIFPEVSLFLSAPNLAYQRASKTDIARGTALDRIKWLSGALRVVRSVKHDARMLLDRRKMRRRLGKTR